MDLDGNDDTGAKLLFQHSEHRAGNTASDSFKIFYHTEEIPPSTSFHVIQLIYQGKTVRSIPNSQFPTGFLLSANQSHWSNEEETLKLLDFVVSPYLIKTKEELGLVPSQVSCIVWDSFTGQDTYAVKSKLEKLNIKEVGVPKNMTHLLQPLDLTTNGITKKIEDERHSTIKII